MFKQYSCPFYRSLLQFNSPCVFFTVKQPKITSKNAKFTPLSKCNFTIHISHIICWLVDRNTFFGINFKTYKIGD